MKTNIRFAWSPIALAVAGAFAQIAYAADELAEFTRPALECLRQPLEGVVDHDEFVPDRQVRHLGVLRHPVPVGRGRREARRTALAFGEAVVAAHDLHAQLLLVQVALVHGSDLELPAG